MNDIAYKCTVHQYSVSYPLLSLYHCSGREAYSHAEHRLESIGGASPSCQADTHEEKILRSGLEYARFGDCEQEEVVGSGSNSLFKRSAHSSLTHSSHACSLCSQTSPAGCELGDHMDPYGDPSGFAPRPSGQDITFSRSCASQNCPSYQYPMSLMRRLQLQPHQLRLTVKH